MSIPQQRLLAIQAELIEHLQDPKQKALIQAGVFRAQGNYDEALKALDRAAKADPNNDKEVLEERFQIALERKDINAAEAMLPTLRRRNLDGCEGGIAAAQIELLKKNYPLALRRTEECLTIRPLMSFGHYLKSRIHQESNTIDAAVESARQAVQMDPLNSLYAKNYASVLCDRNTARAARVTRDQQNELVQALTLAIRLNPNDWQLQSVYAETISAETPDRALAIRQRLFESHPSTANAIMLGNMAMRMAQNERDVAKKTGLIELSGKAFNQAFEREPDNEMVLAAYADYLRQTQQSEKAEELLRGDKNLLWRFYLQSGQLDKAKAQLEQLHQEDPRDTTVLRGLILTAENMGSRADQKNYLDLLAKTADDKNDELWLIERYLEAGFIGEADKKLASVSERHPDEKLILLLEAWSKMAKGQLNEGLTLTNRYLEHDRDNAAAWRLRGRLNRLMNEPRRAIDDLQRSKSLNPIPAVSMELANVYREIGQVDAAVGELITGLESPQAPQQMRLMLESFYQQYNRIPDLEQFYRQTLEKYPQSAFWYRQVGQFYLSQKKADRAVPYLKAAWQLMENRQPIDLTTPNLYLKAMIDNGQYNDAFTAASALVDGLLASLAYYNKAVELID
jgi:tetratricopeptide (TPR) repeat protein